MTINELEYQLEMYIVNNLGWRNTKLTPNDIINSGLNKNTFPIDVICFHYPYFYNTNAFNIDKKINVDDRIIKRELENNWYKHPQKFDAYLLFKLGDVLIKYFNHRHMDTKLNIWFNDYGYINNARKYEISYNISTNRLDLILK